MGRVLSRSEALQSPVHAGGTYAQAHRRETTQVHGEKLHCPACTSLKKDSLKMFFKYLGKSLLSNNNLKVTVKTQSLFHNTVSLCPSYLECVRFMILMSPFFSYYA